MKDEVSLTSKDENEAYQNLVDCIQRHASRELSEGERHEAVRNLVTFCKTVIAIKKRMRENQKHDKHY